MGRFTVVLNCLLIAAAAIAQAEDAPQRHVPTVVNAPGQPDGGVQASAATAPLAEAAGELPLAAAPEATSEDTADRPAEPAATAEPSEPAYSAPPGNWISFDRPLEEPAYPTVDYLLVAPPAGVFQHEPECQTYLQSVASAEDLFFYNACHQPPIDLYRPDGLSPLGVYGANLLSAGQAIVSYQYAREEFSGNNSGTSEVSTEAVLADFPIAATRMVREQHLLLLQYAPTDDLTLLASLPFLQTNMSYLDRNGAGQHTTVTDPGDIPITALYSLKTWDRQQLHLNFGISLPLGMFERQTDVITPLSPEGTYPMRTGSGTFDLQPGLTYRGQSDWWSWGAQAVGTIRTGRNRLNYRLGDAVDMTAWIQRRLNDRLSASFRLDGRLAGNIHGADARLDPTLVQTNVTGLHAYQRLNTLLGLNCCLPDCRFGSQRLSVEGGVPVYQHLTGPQLRQQWVLTAGWQLLF